MTLPFTPTNQPASAAGQGPGVRPDASLLANILRRFAPMVSMAAAAMGSVGCRGSLLTSIGFLPPQSTGAGQTQPIDHAAGNVGTSPAISAPPQESNTPPQEPNKTPAPNLNACAGRQVQACDDFEATPVGSPPDPSLWALRQYGTDVRIVVDDTRAHRGTKAVHLHTGNQGFQDARLAFTGMFPAPNNAFFGRVHIYLVGPVPQNHFNLLAGIGVLPGQSSQTTVNLGGQFGHFIDNYYNANDPGNILDLWRHSGVDVNGARQNSTPVPSDRWACLEWQLDGSRNFMNMWLDGEEVPGIALQNISPECCPSIVWRAPPYTEAAVGFTIVGDISAYPGFDMWMDDLAFDYDRIGCAPSP